MCVGGGGGSACSTPAGSCHASPGPNRMQQQPSRRNCAPNSSTTSLPCHAEYTVLRTLGCGGVSKVKLCQDGKGRQVAVKIFGETSGTCAGKAQTHTRTQARSLARSLVLILALTHTLTVMFERMNTRDAQANAHIGRYQYLNRHSSWSWIGAGPK